MENAIQIFTNEQFGSFRAVEKNGEGWLIASDVCKELDVDNVSQALTRLDDDEKDTIILNEGNAGAVSGGWIENKVRIINEAGFYRLVLSSRKKDERVKKFQRWVTHEVLPAIRKHGAYMTGATLDEIADNPDLLMKLAQNLKAEREKRIAAEKTIEEQKPKVIFADAVETSQNSILVGELAKLIKQNGVEIGQNRLFDWLRENGYLIKGNRADKNMPTQAAMEMKLFEVKERTINNPDGSIRITRTPKVTGKGQTYFVNKLLKIFGL